VAGARVVEPRRDVGNQAHLAPHREHAADQPVAERRHEVLHLSDAVGHQEARDEDVRVREVQLLGAPGVPVGCDAEAPPAIGVEDRPEDARRVEPRVAVPIDRPVGSDERRSVQVADQAVLRDGQVVRHR
jgi:hypothetical protein